MSQRALEVVDHRQPLPGHLHLSVRPGLADLARAPLAQVLQVSQCAQSQVLELGNPCCGVGYAGLLPAR